MTVEEELQICKTIIDDLIYAIDVTNSLEDLHNNKYYKNAKAYRLNQLYGRKTIS